MKFFVFLLLLSLTSRSGCLEDVFGGDSSEFGKEEEGIKLPEGQRDIVSIPRDVLNIADVLKRRENRAGLVSSTKVYRPKFIETVLAFDQSMVDFIEETSFDYRKHLRRFLWKMNMMLSDIGVHVIITKQMNLTHSQLPSPSHERSAEHYNEEIFKANVKFVSPIYRQDLLLVINANTSFDPDKIAGAAFMGTACLHPLTYAVAWIGIRSRSKDSKGQLYSDQVWAETATHEVGHFLGLYHEDYETETSKAFGSCSAPVNQSCIMGPAAKGGNKVWSNYSKLMMSEIEDTGVFQCLYRKPNKATTRFQICRNGMIEPGETCDCIPSDLDCRKCCNISSCQLLPGAKCSSGGCCSDCKVIRNSNVSCFPLLDRCDKEDFCDGETEFCEDKRWDGKNCSDAIGTPRECVKGTCEDKCYGNCFNHGVCQKKPKGSYEGFFYHTCVCDGEYKEWFCQTPVGSTSDCPTKKHEDKLSLVAGVLYVSSIIVISGHHHHCF